MANWGNTESGKRGTAARASQKSNGSQSWADLCEARARRRGPIWPESFDPKDYPERTLEEMLKDE
jgi:hypothetical protein